MSLARLCKRIFGGSPSIWMKEHGSGDHGPREWRQWAALFQQGEWGRRESRGSFFKTHVTDAGCETQDASCIARAAPSWLPLGDTPLVQSGQQQHLSEVTTPLREGARRFFRVHFGPHKTSCLKCTGVGTQLPVRGLQLSRTSYVREEVLVEDRSGDKLESDQCNTSWSITMTDVTKSQN